MVETDCKIRAANTFEIHLAVQIIHVFDFDYFRMHVKILMSLFTGWYSHYWVVNLVLLKILSRPRSQTINYRNIGIIVEGVLKERWCFWLIVGFLFPLPSHLACWYHIWAWWLLVSFKNYPVRFLPDVAVELLVPIVGCYVDSADSNDITNLDNVGQLA